jgi:hypothetical protein
MDFFTYVNIWAVLVCGVASMVVGGVWYSPFLFGKIWQKEVDLSDEKIKNTNMPVIFISTFLLTVIMAVNMAIFFGGQVGLNEGLLYGFFTGLFWVSAALGVIYLYERKSFMLWFINGGYQIIMFTIIGGIIGAWH